MNYRTILRKYAEKYKFSYMKSNNESLVDAGQYFAQNLIDIILLSQRSASVQAQGIVNESFEGLDFRRCAGKGYYCKNTHFNSCFLNYGFFSQTTHFMGAVYLKFIGFSGNPSKFIASISEYGYFSIVEFDTGVVLFHREYKGFHNDDVIYSIEYKEYILVALYGTDNFHEATTSVLFVFDKKSFKFMRELDGGDASLDVWNQLNHYYPLRRPPHYRGWSPLTWRYDDDEPVDPKDIEYTISFETNITGFDDKFVDRKFKIFNAKRYISSLYDTAYEDEILSDNLFCFLSDNGERKLFVGYLSKNVAIELQLEDVVNIHFLKDIIFTEDRKRMLAYQTDQPWLYVWDLPSGHFSKFKVAEYGVYALACTHDGKYAVTSGNDNNIKTIDLKFGKQIRQIRDNIKIESARLLTDSLYAIGLENGFIKLWDLDHQRFVSVVCAHDKAVSGIITASDGRIITYSDDCSLKIWKLDYTQKTLIPVASPLRNHTTGVRSVVAIGNKLLSLSWSEIIEWDLSTLVPLSITSLRDILASSKDKSAYSGLSNFLDFNPSGTLLPYSLSSNDRSLDDDCGIISFYDLEKYITRSNKILTKSGTDNLVFSPCGKFAAFEFAYKVCVYDVSLEEPQHITTIQTDWKRSVFPEVSHDDAPGDKAFFRQVHYIAYIKDGQILVVSTREGVIYFYETIGYTLIDVKCMRGNLTFIDYISRSNSIIASDWNSIYVWDQDNNTVEYTPNLNAGFVGCEINNLVTQDISTGVLYILERNGVNVDGKDPSGNGYQRNSDSWITTDSIKQPQINYLIGNTYCDYGDSINVFMQNDTTHYDEAAITLNYLRCLYRSPVAKETILPLLLIEGIGRLYFHKGRLFEDEDYKKILADAFNVFLEYPCNKSEISTMTTAVMMAKCILWSTKKGDADFAYEILFNGYIKKYICFVKQLEENSKEKKVSILNDETSSILANSLFEIAEDQSDMERVKNIAQFISDNFYTKTCDVGISYMYMKILFHLIKSQPQELRLDTLDEMYRVYSDNYRVQEGYAYLYARACDHYCGEYLIDSTSINIHHLEMVATDLKNVISEYPENPELLFTLLTYLVALNGQKEIMKAYGERSIIIKSMFGNSPFKKIVSTPEKSVDDILEQNPQLWEVKEVMFRMIHAYSVSSEDIRVNFPMRMKRITDLLNIYYNFLD